MTSGSEIAECVRRTLDQYFTDLDGESPNGVYEMVMQSAERPLLETVLSRTNGNQTLAAEILGINRNTLRRKLAEYKLL